jgi:hypothetical protein
MEQAVNSQPKSFSQDILVLILNIGEVVQHPASTSPNKRNNIICHLRIAKD